MSLYCTLPRRSRLTGGRVTIETTPPTSPLHSAYWLRANRVPRCGLDSSLTSIHTFPAADWQCQVSPTEASDSVTFSESVTSAFEEYSHRVYYASDSFHLATLLHGSMSANQTPNFYAEDDDSDSEPSQLELTHLGRLSKLGPTPSTEPPNATRPRSRRSVDNLSIRLRKLYRPLFGSDTLATPCAERKHSEPKLGLVKVLWKDKLNSVLKPKWFQSGSASKVDPVTNQPRRRFPRYFSFRQRKRSSLCLEEKSATRAVSVAGIKKRPLSMQFDLRRVSQACSPAQSRQVPSGFPFPFPLPP